MGPIAAVRCPVDHDKTARTQSARQATRPPGTDANHLFANNVRFLSMAAIIAFHTIGIYPLLHHGEAPPLLLRCVEQLLKFGTIAFFLIAGFLFGERIELYSSAEYYRRRMKNVFLPWTFWYVTYASLRLLHRYDPSMDWPTRIREALSFSLLDTAYWFVPNLLIALAVLLMFRRALRDTRVGILLLLASLFYALNIYGRWIPVQHYRAVFGFVFYLWLGAWGSWHFAAIQKWLDYVGTGVICGLLLLTYVMSMAETRLLSSFHSADPLNVLRISNQVYSVVAVLLLIRLKRALWPRFVNVRTDTFGLYLTHSVVLAVSTVALLRLVPQFPLASFWESAPGASLAVLVVFAVIYGGCLFVVRGILSCRWLRWAVGLPKSESAARKSHPHPNAASVVSGGAPGPANTLSALPVRN